MLETTIPAEAHVLQSGSIEGLSVGGEVADGGQEPHWILGIHSALDCPAIDANVLLPQTQRLTWTLCVHHTVSTTIRHVEPGAYVQCVANAEECIINGGFKVYT